jgi:hypothetical protein
MPVNTLCGKAAAALPESSLLFATDWFRQLVCKRMAPGIVSARCKWLWVCLRRFRLLCGFRGVVWR